MNVFVEFTITIAVAVGAAVTTYEVASRDARAQRFLTRIQITPRQANAIFLALACLFGLVFGSLAVLTYLSLNSGNDLGQYDQLIWNTLRGRILENSVKFDAPNFLGKSFTPILLALVPLYAVWSNPILLMLVQVLGFLAGAFPVYWLARQRAGHLIALAIVIVYFLFPAVDTAGYLDFREQALFMPFLAFATFFLLRKHYAGFIVSLALALLVKEESAFIAIGFGAYIFLVQRKRAFGLALMFFAGLWAIAVLQYVIPFFQGNAGNGTFYYFGRGELGGAQMRYTYLGSNLSEIFRTLVTRPSFVLSHVLIPGKIEYVLHFLVPLAFLPFIGLEVLALALPTLGYTLLSDYPYQYSIWEAYPPPLLPFVFMGAAIGAGRLLWWNAAHASTTDADPVRATDYRAREYAMVSMLLVSSGLNYFFQSTGPLALRFSAHRYAFNSHAALGHTFAGLIPPDAALVTQPNFMPLLANRQAIYEIPLVPDYRQVDYLYAERDSA